MPRQLSRRARIVAVSALAMAASACGAGLPASVVQGSSVQVGWTHDLTSTNTATRSGATVGNLDLAAMTRGRFGQRVDGDVVVDKDFGTVTVRDPDAESFTVRYDLRESDWSDGIPVDAADLMLAWAAGSNALGPADGQDAFDSVPGDLRHSEEVPALHEFDRWIEVRYTRPVLDWQTALDVAVPAHVVGAEALDIDDPMEAKQAVIRAIEDRDREALAAIARVWNTGFVLRGKGGKVTHERLLSSGPYVIDRIDQDDSGTQRVRLAVNTSYDRSPSPTFEQVELVRATEAGQLADLGGTLDVAHVAPTAEHWGAVRALGRRDFDVSSAHDGRMWVLVLRTDRGVFGTLPARLAFLRTVPRAEVANAGAGPWTDDYESTDALLFSPRSSGYGIVLEDSGFRVLLSKAAGKADVERSAAGVPAGAPVCVLHDKDDGFARAAFAALRAGVAEAGWAVRDCGARDAAAAAPRTRNWHAALLAVPVPETAGEIAALWGSGGLSGFANSRRDRLITQLGSAADKYAARDLRVQVEASLVADAVAVPLTMQPMITVAVPQLDGVVPQPGPAASLTSGVLGWHPPDQ